MVRFLFKTIRFMIRAVFSIEAIYFVFGAMWACTFVDVIFKVLSPFLFYWVKRAFLFWGFIIIVGLLSEKFSGGGSHGNFPRKV